MNIENEQVHSVNPREDLRRSHKGSFFCCFRELSSSSEGRRIIVSPLVSIRCLEIDAWTRNGTRNISELMGFGWGSVYQVGTKVVEYHMIPYSYIRYGMRDIWRIGGRGGR